MLTELVHVVKCTLQPVTLEVEEGLQIPCGGMRVMLFVDVIGGGWAVCFRAVCVGTFLGPVDANLSACFFSLLSSLSFSQISNSKVQPSGPALCIPRPHHLCHAPRQTPAL